MDFNTTAMDFNTTAMYTNGITTLNYQPKENDVALIRQCLHSNISLIKEPEIVLHDSIAAIHSYPFAISFEKIANFELKLENTTVSIHQYKIVSDKPIFIETSNDILRIWNILVTPHNILGTQGNTYVDGYNILDFNNNSIKSVYSYVNTSWNIPNFDPIKKIILNGNGNSLFVEKQMNKDLILKISGTNQVSIKHNIYDKLDIQTTNCTFDFENASCNNLFLDIKGNGKINNLCVLVKSAITITGSQILNLKKSDKAECYEKIYGPGKVIWTIE